MIDPETERAFTGIVNGIGLGLMAWALIVTVAQLIVYGVR